MGLRRRILLRLRPAVVIAIVVLAVIVLATAVVACVALAFSMVLVTLAVTVVRAMPPLLCMALFHIGLLAHASLRRRRDPAAGRALGRREARERGSGEAGLCGGSGASRCGRSLARHHRVRPAAGARRSGGRGRRCDDRGDLAGPSRRSRDRGVASRQIQEAWGSQYEGDRCRYGEHADHGCSYARKTAPHESPIGASAPSLNLSRRNRTSRPLREDFLQHQCVCGRLGNPSIPSGASVPGCS
jgi:hypothetical protein